jgi:hypothetical protein
LLQQADCFAHIQNFGPVEITLITEERTDLRLRDMLTCTQPYTGSGSPPPTTSTDGSPVDVWVVGDGSVGTGSIVPLWGQCGGRGGGCAEDQCADAQYAGER